MSSMDYGRVVGPWHLNEEVTKIKELERMSRILSDGGPSPEPGEVMRTLLVVASQLKHFPDVSSEVLSLVTAVRRCYPVTVLFGPGVKVDAGVVELLALQTQRGHLVISESKILGLDSRDLSYSEFFGYPCSFADAAFKASKLLPNLHIFVERELDKHPDIPALVWDNSEDAIYRVFDESRLRAFSPGFAEPVASQLVKSYETLGGVFEIWTRGPVYHCALGFSGNRAEGTGKDIESAQLDAARNMYGLGLRVPVGTVPFRPGVTRILAEKSKEIINHWAQVSGVSPVYKTTMDPAKKPHEAGRFESELLLPGTGAFRTTRLHDSKAKAEQEVAFRAATFLQSQNFPIPDHFLCVSF